jgi:RHS repeat-associated protein
MRLRVPVAVFTVDGASTSARVGRLTSASAGALLAALAFAATVAAAPQTQASLESPGVREVLSHQLQVPGPTVVSQGGSGGQGDAPAPAGKLVPSLSTAFSDTWSAPHSPRVTRLFNTPVNYKATDGQWHAIDNTLAASPLGGYENTANSFSLRLPESLASGVSLTYQGQTVSFSLQGASASLPAVSGDTATYREVLSSTDLAYVSQETGVREIATLKDASAPTQLRYSLSLPAGLSPKQQADGSLAMVDAQGDVVFSIPAPVAFRPGAGPASGRQVPSTITTTGSSWTITVNTGEAWLREDLATGAMAIDPTVSLSASQGCSLESETPTNGWCTSNEQRVGYDSTHTENHALLKFDVSSLPLAATILNAKLGLYVEAHTTSNIKPVGVYRVTKPWTTSANWETYDGTHAWTTKGGDYANPETNSDASLNPSVGGANGWYYWYPTKMVQEWVNTADAPSFEGKPEGYANEGLIVKDQTDNATQNMLSLRSPNAPTNKPFLEVAYEPRGVGSEPQYTQLSTPLSDKSGLSVNVASGNLSLQASQLEMPGIAGLGFSSARVWNGLNPEKQEYGHWQDSNGAVVKPQGDGSLTYEDGAGTWFEFQKQANGSFITPPGIKGTMCAAGSPSPCPASLPTGVSYQLIYHPSEHLTNFNVNGTAIQYQDRYKNAIGLEFPSEHHGLFTDTHGHKVEQVNGATEHYISEIKDLSGERNAKFSYETFAEGEPELASATDANGKTTSYGYSNYTIVKVTDPKGNVTKLAYDTKGRVTEVVRTTNTEHTTGPTTKFTYYDLGSAPSPCTSKQRGTLVKDPDWEKAGAHETLYCSNVLDEVEKVIDANKNETTAAFDPFGNATSTTSPIRETGAKAGITSYIYGAAGQNLTCEVEGTAEKPPACPSEAIKPGYSTNYEYTDATFAFSATKVTSQRRKDSNVCYWSGSHACTGSGPSEFTGPAGAVRRITDPLASENSINFSYNSNGTVSAIQDQAGHTTTYEYDSSGNLKTVAAPSGSGIGKQTITVDSDSRPRTITQCLAESGGTCTSSETGTITYDKVDRVTEAVYTGPGATKTFKYVYDGDGNVEKREDPSGETTFKVDALNRITEESLPEALGNVYSYDPASNLISFTDAGGGTHYFYDGLNHLTSMYEPGGSCSEPVSKCTAFEHDKGGGLTKITYPSKASISYALDETTGRPLIITAKGPSGTALLSNSYGYVSEAADSPLIFGAEYVQGTTKNKTLYEYDALDRLVEATTSGTNKSHYVYELDGVGNRKKQQVSTSAESGGTETFYRVNAGNQLECTMKTSAACSKSSTSEISGYEYNLGGSETAIKGYADPASTTFTYNNAERLATLTPPASEALTLEYLGFGATVLKKLGSTTLQTSTLGLIRQTSASGTSYYARTPGGLLIDERLPGSESYNPIYDAQGDIVGLLNTAGELKQTVRYGPYGDNAQAGGTLAYSATNDPFLFQGGYHLAGGNPGLGNVPNNLYHYGERYYDPTTGRWTQQDPVGIGHPYAFVGDDPINATDPSGQVSVPSWLLRTVGRVAKVVGGYSIACLTAKASGWKIGHPWAIAHYQGPSVSTVLGWAWDCSEVKNIKGDIEEALGL